MSKPSPINPFLYVSKPVKDEYGRYVGRIVSFSIAPNGRVNDVLLLHDPRRP